MTVSTNTEHAARPDALYRHTKRNEWGLAIMAWDRQGRRAYQFEDGVLRVFANGFHSLMEPVDRPIAEAQPIIDRLVVKLAENDAEAATARKAAASKPQPLSVEDQVAFFITQYEKGFFDAAWRHDVRGSDAKRRLKRHRDPAISSAREILSAERLSKLMADQQFGKIYEDVSKVLESSDLVTPAQLKVLANVDARHHQSLARAVRDLLYGDGPSEQRFGKFLETLTEATGSAPSWQLATALGALVHPEAHVCVRATTFREQAKSMAPRLDVKNVPSAAAYERLVAMAKSVHDKLKAHDLAPRDLMDVYDFMRVTLAPKARKQVEALRASRSATDASAEAA